MVDPGEFYFLLAVLTSAQLSMMIVIISTRFVDISALFAEISAFPVLRYGRNKFYF